MTTTPFGRLAVIADLGAGEVASKIPEVEARLDGLGLDHSLNVSRSPQQTTRLAAAALGEGLRYLVAVGDDGTVQDVVNAIFRAGRPVVEDPILAVVPAGTSCDLARSFGLPLDVEEAVKHLVDDNTYRFDVMKIQVAGQGPERARYAHNLAYVGMHAAAHTRASALPRWLGNARRFLGFWSAYATSGPREIKLGIDMRSTTLQAWSVVVGNGQFTDGGMRLSPRSYPGDGVLDVLAFTGPRSDAYRMLPRIFRHGDHIPDDNIAELRAKIRVGLETSRPMPVVADGRFVGRTPVSIQCVPQQILLKI
jgi:YegS/Rv2252/BmrU family lipid kinase